MSTQEVVPTSQMSDEQFSEYVMRILARELGETGVTRFLGLNPTVTGDYTRDRGKWQKGLTVRQIMADIEKHREISKIG